MLCCVEPLSRVQLFATLGTLACQAPLSMGFFRQEYWSGLSFPPPGDPPSPGIEPASPVSPALQEDSLPAELLQTPFGDVQTFALQQTVLLGLKFVQFSLYFITF